jgi:hypothetical protein
VENRNISWMLSSTLLQLYAPGKKFEVKRGWEGNRKSQLAGKEEVVVVDRSAFNPFLSIRSNNFF